MSCILFYYYYYLFNIYNKCKLVSCKLNHDFKKFEFKLIYKISEKSEFKKNYSLFLNKFYNSQYP